MERTHLELAEAQVVALDLGGGARHRAPAGDAAPETLRGRVQLAMLAWPTGALDEAAAALAGAIEREPNDVEARMLLAELHVATNKIAAAPRRRSRRRSIAPRRRWRSRDAFAGWLVLRGEVDRGAASWRIGWSANAGDADALAAASALERTVKRPDRARRARRARRQSGPRRPARCRC